VKSLEREAHLGEIPHGDEESRCGSLRLGRKKGSELSAGIAYHRIMPNRSSTGKKGSGEGAAVLMKIREREDSREPRRTADLSEDHKKRNQTSGSMVGGEGEDNQRVGEHNSVRL